MAEGDIEWRRCDDCDTPYFVGATLSPHVHQWMPIPLSLVPSSDVDGNFQVDWGHDPVEVFDGEGDSLGRCPIVAYGRGPYRPHNPSHFLDDEHDMATEEARVRSMSRHPHNIHLAMEDPDGA